MTAREEWAGSNKRNFCVPFAAIAVQIFEDM
eukprot:CAMPEP_0178944844 /NCGR_PEP_ID=MMETSP0789-20121207/3389_1 /TAXON_ID=3005 /ORGANISM="Rhizosolenia setigera, Strain CCMP 1694" /LENGTH=30 /DNA_ID= /DNA_START= /DNA_END= /DNA_ORIENTATION=